MAVQRITHKTIKKFDERDGNFQPTPQPKKEVDGNIVATANRSRLSSLQIEERPR